MLSKLFEIRDKATFIPVLCTKFESFSERDRFLLGRSGFNTDRLVQSTYMVTIRLQDMQCEFKWNQFPRTMNIAHEYIKENWHTLCSGEVIDVEFILGETNKPKKSEADS